MIVVIYLNPSVPLRDGVEVHPPFAVETPNRPRAPTANGFRGQRVAPKRLDASPAPSSLRGRKRKGNGKTAAKAQC